MHCAAARGLCDAEAAGADAENALLTQMHRMGPLAVLLQRQAVDVLERRDEGPTIRLLRCHRVLNAANE